MVGVTSEGLRGIQKAFKETRDTGSTGPMWDASLLCFGSKISKGTKGRAIAGMEEILKKKHGWQRPVNGRQMSKDEIKLKAELQMKGIPESGT